MPHKLGHQKDNKAFNMMLSGSEKDNRGKSFKVVTDAINKMQKSPKAKNILNKISHKSKTEKSDKERQTLNALLDRYEELESGNIQIADFGKGQTSADWGGELQKSGRYGKNAKFRPATKDELSYHKKLVGHHLKDLGVVDIRKREKGIKSDVILEDVERYFPGSLGFMGDNRIFMGREPLDPKGKLSWDKTYHHELGHQKRALAGKFLSQEGKHWHNRPEEQQATRDALNDLKKNYKDAGIPFNKIDAHRWLSGSSELKAMENPSRAPFIDRMEYLPTGQSYDKFSIESDWRTGKPVKTTYDNPGDFMDVLNKSKTGMLSTGLDIKYPKMSGNLKFPSPEYSGRLKTYWDLVNE